MVTRKIYMVIDSGETTDGEIYSIIDCFGSKEECKKCYDAKVKDLEEDIVRWYSDITIEQVREIGAGKTDDTHDRFGYNINETCVSWSDWEDSCASEVIKWEEREVGFPETKKIWEV